MKTMLNATSTKLSLAFATVLAASTLALSSSAEASGPLIQQHVEDVSGQAMLLNNKFEPLGLYACVNVVKPAPEVTLVAAGKGVDSIYRINSALSLQGRSDKAKIPDFFTVSTEGPSSDEVNSKLVITALKESGMRICGEFSKFDELVADEMAPDPDHDLLPVVDEMVPSLEEY